MAKLILLSDMHLVAENPKARLDDLTEIQFDKVRYVFSYVRENSIDAILQAGDMVDIKRSWGLLSRLSQFYREEAPCSIYTVRGQHDAYYRDMSNEKTVIGVLTSAALLHHLGHAVPLAKSVYGYGVDYGQEPPKPTTRGVNILVIHKQILMSKIWKQQNDHDYAPEFLRAHSDYDLILCGDAHQRFVFTDGDRHICNTGPMLRLEVSKQMMRHSPGFFVYDTSRLSLKWVVIPHALASAVLSRQHIEEAQARQMSFKKFIDGVSNVAQTGKSPFLHNLRMLLRQGKASNTVKDLVYAKLEEIDGDQ
jgi:predicted phosphodiesterase